MLVSYFSIVNMWLYQNRTSPWIFIEECSYFFHDLYLFSEPTNNHCLDRAAQGQLPKCNLRNTITTISSLIKGSWLKQNKKELNNVGDTELNFSTIKFISKQLHSQKQWKSKTSNMLWFSRNVITTSRTWELGAGGTGPGDTKYDLSFALTNSLGCFSCGANIC